MTPVGEVVDPDRRCILALGGHELNRRRGNEAITDYVLRLVPDRPRICLLPTASGDPREQITAFRTALRGSGAEVSHVSLFRLEHEPIAVREHLLAQDLVYVGGGSMVNLLAIWRAHGLDAVLVEAWRRGVVLCGQSAGAMCWFERGITRSVGGAAVVEGLGLLQGIVSVHYHRDDDRRRSLIESALAGLQPALGFDDSAGAIFRGTRLSTAISAIEDARVWSVRPDGAGRVRETALDCEHLQARRPAIDEPAAEIVEMRELRFRRTPARSGVIARAERRTS
jgi:dipeptidase E